MGFFLEIVLWWLVVEDGGSILIIGFSGSEFLQLKQIAHNKYRLHLGQFAIRL